MATDQQSIPMPATTIRPPARGGLVELHVVLERLVTAADAGDPLEAFLNAAGAAQIVADRLQGADGEISRLHAVALPPAARRSAGRAVALRLLDAAAATTAATRGRLGLSEWHVTLRDLANVLAEAVLRDSDPQADGPDAKGMLRSVATTVDGLRSGIPPQAARLLAGSALRPPSCFTALDLHPVDVAALAGRFAEEHPDRERPLLVLGLRSSGAYLAPLAAAALGRLGYRHVVARTTRAGGPLVPEEPRLIESARRVAGLVLLLGSPPSSGASMASVAARLLAAGFAAERVLPVYPALDDAGQPPALLRRHPCVALPAGEWRIAERLTPPALTAALEELLPAGESVEEGSVRIDRPDAPDGRRAHRSVGFTAVVRGADGERRLLTLRAEGTGLIAPTRRRPGTAGAGAGAGAAGGVAGGGVAGGVDGLRLSETAPAAPAPVSAAPEIGSAPGARGIVAPRKAADDASALPEHGEGTDSADGEEDRGGIAAG